MHDIVDSDSPGANYIVESDSPSANYIVESDSPIVNTFFVLLFKIKLTLKVIFISLFL